MAETGQLAEFWATVKDVWNVGVYGLDLGQVLLALVIFLSFVMLRNLLTRFVLNRMRNWAARTTTELDDAIIDALEAPLRLIPIVMGAFFATNVLELTGGAAEFVANINRSLIALAIFWALFSASNPVTGILLRSKRFLTQPMILWLSKAAKLAFSLLGAATVLEIWGIQVGPIIAGLGLFGVAVALGAQNLFKNLIAGLFVIGERRFMPGDWILVDGVVEGTVEKIGFRTTTVRRFDKAPVYVPNAVLADQSVTNFTRMTYRRISWTIGLRYDASAQALEAVRDGIAAYLHESSDFVRPEETATFVRIDSFGASSVNIILYCFTHTTNWLEWLEIKERLLLRIKNVVADAGTDFAFPSQSLYVEGDAPARPSNAQAKIKDA